MKAKKLDELCDFISGLWTGKKPPYINVGVIRNTNFHKSGNLDFSDIAQLEVEAKQFNTRQLRFGDIVLEKSGGGPKQPVGRVCVFEKSEGLFSLSNFTSAIRVKNTKELDYKYLHYYLKHLYVTGETEKIQSHSTGIRNLQLSLYKEFSVPLPPLATQQKIVAKLDAIFAEIDKATAAAEANAKNAEALFQSYLTEIFERGGEGWKDIKFGDIADFRNGINFLKSERGVTVKILGVKNFQSNFIAPLNDLDTVTLDDMVPDVDLIKNDDILFVRSNGNLELIGRCILIEQLIEKITFSGFTIRARLNVKNIYSKFLCFALKSAKVRRTMIEGGNGANIKSLNQNTLSNLMLRIPNGFDAQVELVRKIENIECQVNYLKASYLSKLNALKIYKQSILKQAFNGELVKE